jgi:hypothetical protein
MAEDIEKFDDNAFINNVGDVLSAADAQALEEIDPKRMKSSRERADQIMRGHQPEPTLEDEAAVNAVFDRAKFDIDPYPGAFLSLKKRAKAMTRIARYYEASEHLMNMDKDAKSFKTNKFNQSYPRDEMLERLASAETSFIESKEKFDDDLSYLARVKRLLGQGLTPDDLQVLRALRVDTRDDIEKLRKGGELSDDRLEIVNRIRTNAGLEPISPIIPDHLNNDFALSPVVRAEEAEKESGCDCNCQRCDNGGGLHCHNKRTHCFV